MTLAGDQIGEAALPDDAVEDLEAGVLVETVEGGGSVSDPLELDGAPVAAEEAAVMEGRADQGASPEVVLADGADDEEGTP